LQKLTEAEKRQKVIKQFLRQNFRKYRKIKVALACPLRFLRRIRKITLSEEKSKKWEITTKLLQSYIPCFDSQSVKKHENLIIQSWSVGTVHYLVARVKYYEQKNV